MKIRSFLSAAALCGLSLSALAQSATPAAAAQTPVVDQRQQRQEARIQQGVASGALTRREARRLHREQSAVAGAEAQAKADGVVTPKERARLQRMQNKSSRDIYRQKHDRQRAAGAP